MWQQAIKQGNSLPSPFHSFKIMGCLEREKMKTIKYFGVIIVLILAAMVFVSTASADGSSTLTVDLSGTWNKDITVQLWTSDGATLLWSQNNQQGGIRSYNVDPNTYDVKLVQGPQTLTVNDVNCTGETCDAGDVIETLTVDLSGSWNKDITVQLYVNDGGLIWSVNNQHGAVRTYNVLKNTYDLKLVQGPKTLNVADINCNGGTCNAGDVIADLTVDLGGTWNKDITVQLKTESGDLIWSVNNQHGALRHYSVLKNTYNVTLVQGPQTLTVNDVNCTGETCDAGDVIETLTVDLSGSWNKDITVQLYVNDGGLIWSVNNQHGAVRTYNVLKNTYDLKLVQGPKTLNVADINCNGGTCNAGDVIADLTVDLGGTWNKDITVQLKTESGDLIWSVNNQNGTLRHYNVLKNTYNVTLVQGPQTLTVNDVNCTGETCDAGDVIETLTVDLGGSWNKDITVQLYVNDGGLIWSVNNQHGAVRTYNVLKDTYDLKLVQGPKTLNVADINCDGGDCDAGDVTADLAVDLSGTWPSSITVQLNLDDGNPGTTGSLIWSVNNQHGAIRHYNVLKNYYDIKLVIGSNTFIWDAVDCTGETCTLDKSTLTVKFPGISGVHTYVYPSNGVAGTVTGSPVASQLNKTDQAVFANLSNGIYDVKIVKGAEVKIVDNVIVLGNNAVVDDIVKTLTIEFPGISGVHSYVKVNDGAPNSATGGDVDSSLNKTDGTTIVVLKGIYDVRLVKGAQANIYDAVDCTDSGSCTLTNIVKTLTIEFPGISGVHSYVKVNDGAPNSATGGDVDSSLNKTDGTTIVVLKGIYDVRLVKGAQANIYDAVDCTDSGSCILTNIVKTLTIEFPGISGVHSYVKVNDSAPNSATGGDVDSSLNKTNGTTIVVLKGIYDVRLVKGAQANIYDAVDCTDSGSCTLTDIVKTLTIEFPGISGVHSYVKVNDSAPNSATGGDVDSSLNKTNGTTIVVLKGIYDVRLVKGAQANIYDAVDCTDSGSCTVDNIVAILTIKFPGMSGVHNYIKVPDNINNSATGGDVDSRLNKTDETVLAVLKGFYDVKLVKGSDSYIYDNVDCTGNTCTLDKATLTVKFPGINNVHTYVYKTNNVNGTVSGPLVASQTYKNSQAVFNNLNNGIYDVKVVKGSEVKIIDNVVVLGNWATVDNIVATLTVHFDGINSVHTYVQLYDGTAGTVGSNVDNRTYKNNSAELVVLRDTYDVKVVKGSEVKIIDGVDCNGATCTVDDIVATLTVHFDGINSVHTYVQLYDGTAGTVGSNVDNRTYKNDSAELVVLRDTYDVKVVKGSEVKIIDGVDCNGAACTVDDIVATLTVSFDGINSVHTYVQLYDGTAGTVGSNVDNRTYKNNSAELVVLRDTYDVKVVKGSEVKIIDGVDCNGATCTVDDIVATLTVHFDGINSVHTYVQLYDGTAGTVGSNVDNRTYKNNSAELVVLRDTYDVKVVKGSEVKIIDGVDCNGATCTVDDIVATLTVHFPGVNSVHTYVQLDDGNVGTTGGNVDNRTYKNNFAELVVLRDTYDVKVVKSSKTNIFDSVNCNATTCEINNSVTGSGTLNSTYGSPTVVFNTNAAPVGTFSITYPTGTGHTYAGANISGEIMCVRFDGATAYLAGLVTASNSSYWSVGQYVRFGVEDGSPDGLNYTPGESTMPDCATFSYSADLSLSSGDYSIMP